MPQRREEVKMDLPNFNQQLEETKQILRQCFKQFDIDEVFLSFNGGKDCTALLDITINVLQDLYHRQDIAKDLKIVYIRTNGPFKEIEQFVTQIEKHYGAKLVVMEGQMKQTLGKILEEDNRLKACLMGTRRTDPYSNDLNYMQKTDPDWPQVVRVSPILDWSYHQIWSYILAKNVPYCSLYDIGYTSIGSTQNTWPNPALSYKDSYGNVSYRPAWFLNDGSLERAGRGSAPKLASNGHQTEQIISDICINGTV